MRRTLSLLGKIVSSLFTGLLAVILACNIYVIGARVITEDIQPRVFGWSSAVVVSGSMEPAIGVHDMILVRESDSYEPGDIISFKSGNAVVTHRIVGETEVGFLTQGDANNVQDRDPVGKENILGKVVLVIPGVGKITEFLRTPLGLLCLTALGFALVILPGRMDGDGGKSKKGGKYAK